VKSQRVGLEKKRKFRNWLDKALSKNCERHDGNNGATVAAMN